jgi:hypothetical protein
MNSGIASGKELRLFFIEEHKFLFLSIKSNFVASLAKSRE